MREVIGRGIERTAVTRGVDGSASWRYRRSAYQGVSACSAVSAGADIAHLRRAVPPSVVGWSARWRCPAHSRRIYTARYRRGMSAADLQAGNQGRSARRAAVTGAALVKTMVCSSVASHDLMDRRSEYCRLRSATGTSESRDSRRNRPVRACNPVSPPSALVSVWPLWKEMSRGVTCTLAAVVGKAVRIGQLGLGADNCRRSQTAPRRPDSAGSPRRDGSIPSGRRASDRPPRWRRRGTWTRPDRRREEPAARRPAAARQNGKCA